MILFMYLHIPTAIIVFGPKAWTKIGQVAIKHDGKRDQMFDQDHDSCIRRWPASNVINQDKATPQLPSLPPSSPKLAEAQPPIIPLQLN
jgi:hypothetical protein